MSTQKQEVLSGVCEFHMETGTDGGYWSFQGNQKQSVREFWSDDNHHRLKDGDYLEIFSKTNPTEIVWSGTISLKKYPPREEAAFGFLIRADQNGIEREQWARWFFEEFPAKLIHAAV